jgi:hypothetical protein
MTKTSKSLNFLWISLGNSLVKEQAQPTVLSCCPIPTAYMVNIIQTAAANPDAEVTLWVDKQRQTPEELRALWLFLRAASKSVNIGFKDLHEIREYRGNSFFYGLDPTSSWRFNKHSLIWRQVDAAKLLVCLQGNYDQVFFADMDIVNLDLNSASIQTPMEKHGMVVGLHPDPVTSEPSFENQFFGFTPGKRPIFEIAYEGTIRQAQLRDFSTNGYEILFSALHTDIRMAGLTFQNVGYKVENSGIFAHHPTRDNCHGMAPDSTTSAYSSDPKAIMALLDAEKTSPVPIDSRLLAAVHELVYIKNK